MSAAPRILPDLASLTRESLPDLAAGYVVKGAWNKADILLVPLAGVDVAVKDYGRKTAIVRWLGAWQLSREARAYGRLDRNAIAIEYVGGIRLPKVHHRMGGVPNVAERLRALLAEVHARGVIHGDLRSRDNFLVTRGGDLYLIDFSSATVFGDNTLMRRLLFKRLRRGEQRALLKWKVALVPEELTSAELASHRRFKRVRKLWPFNRKRDLPRTRGRNPYL